MSRDSQSSSKFIRVDWIDAPSQWVAKRWLCRDRPTKYDKKNHNYEIYFVDHVQDASGFPPHTLVGAYAKLKSMLPETANIVMRSTHCARFPLESEFEKEERRLAYEEYHRSLKAAQQQEFERRLAANNKTINLGSAKELQNLSNKVDCGHCGICRDCLERLGKL